MNVRGVGFMTEEKEIKVFKYYVVRFRGEEWHAIAVSKEAVMTIFASTITCGRPRPEECSVEEIDD